MNTTVLFVCHELSQNDVREDEAAILRFPRLVNPLCPEVHCQARRLPDNLMAGLFETVEAERTFDNCAVAASEYLVDKLHELPMLVVCCKPDASFAQKAMVAAPHAMKGCHCGRLAAVYHHDRYIVWHEMFHLLGAEDCYTEKGGYIIADCTCGNKECIMQYDPTVEKVSDPPFICEANVARIRQQWLKETHQS